MNVIQNGVKQKKRRFPDWLLPTVLMLLGAALRLICLGTVPGGFHQDEAFVALNAFGLFHEHLDSAGIRFPIYMSSWGDGQSALYIWLLAPLLSLNGGHVNAFLCRLPQAVVAIFTLWAVYRLMICLFDRKTGLWSLFLLAVCPWHVMMSRWGLDANLAPGFLIFGLYFFVRGLENKKFLPLSAIFYGLSLYCYALVWPILPIMLLLQIIYGCYFKKLHPDRWSIFSALLLLLMALPLILFVFINADLIPEISLPFMTIPRTSGYRGSELATGIPAMWSNLRTALILLVKQNTGSPYDILLPWGLFYDLGRLFILIGVCAMIYRLIKSFQKKQFAGEFFLFAPLAGGAITCLLVSARLHQINSLFIPLVLCEAYGVRSVLDLLRNRHRPLAAITTGIIASAYLVCMTLFQIDYYTDYKDLVNAYFAQGVEECVDFAVKQCAQKGIHTISAEKGTQWPRLLLFTGTLPSEYLSTVTYDVAPAPASFDTLGLHINTRINYDTIGPDSIYIIYFTDIDIFEQDFDLTQFYDWYVAVPKTPFPIR